MRNIYITDEAKNDLDEIWYHIALDSLNYADRQIYSITNKFKMIVDFPEIGPARDDLKIGLRCYVVDQYTIYYRIFKEYIEITRVLHQARDIEDKFAE